MKTPAGKECSHFYGDYYRGREHEECRLVGPDWSAGLCRSCPVPGIERANACENMTLHVTIHRPVDAFFQKRIKVTPSCAKTGRSRFDPHLGCGECHPVPFIFEVKK